MGQDRTQHGRTRQRTGTDRTRRDKKKTKLGWTGHSMAVEGQAKTRATEGQDSGLKERKGRWDEMRPGKERTGKLNDTQIIYTIYNLLYNMLKYNKKSM